MQLAVCLLTLVLLGIEFMIYGVAFMKLFRLKFRKYETVLIGFFTYFGLFQAAALPLILLQRPFHELVFLWLFLVAAVNIYVLAAAGKDLGVQMKSVFAGLWRNKGVLLLAVITLVLFCCWFAGTQQYVGFDTSYYIGTVDTTAMTDTMYVYNGESGIIEKELDFRYALSSFYMHSAILCWLTGIGGMLIQHYVLGTLCVLMHAYVVFLLGMRLFADAEKKAVFFTGLVFVLHLGFHTGFTVSDFLLMRSYEAKGFCANVVIPAVFYAVLCLWKDTKKRENWALSFVVCFSSIPLSMSSMVIVPAILVIAVLAEWLTERSWQILWRTFWCVLPNAVYVILYLIYTRGFRIPIR